ncbi:MAG: hypothetical protein RL642_810 [Bacteroidota bacterium]
MKWSFLWGVLFFSIHVCLAQGLPAIGQWRDHLPLRSVVAMTSTNNEIVAGTRYGLFKYDPTSKEIITKTKANGLSQVAIELISKDPTSDQLLIAYEQADLDLLLSDQVRNLPDLFKSSTRGNRKVNHVSWIGRDAWLSTNFGIVVVNTEKFEIKNTYRIGQQGEEVQVFQTALLNGNLYAASERGLLRANINAAALNDFRNWNTEAIQDHDAAVDRVLVWKNQLIVKRNDSLFIQQNFAWRFLFSNGKKITALEVVNDRLLIGNVDQAKASVLLLDPSNTNLQEINSPYLSYPTAAVMHDGEIWVGDLANGIINVSASNTSPVFPETPAGLAFGDGVYANVEVLVVSGQDQQQLLPQNGIYRFADGQWKSTTAADFTELGNVRDIRTVAYSKKNGSLYAGAAIGGLIEITKDNTFKRFASNSFLSPLYNNTSVYSIGGLVVDQEEHLWMTNSGAQQGLIVLKHDGSIQKFSIPFSYTDFGLSKLIVDDQNRKWIATSNNDGLFCFDQGSSLDNRADDRWRHFKQGLGRGNLPSDAIKSLACDRNGFIWIGTDKGVAVFQCVDELFSAVACEAVLPVVQQDNFAGRLLAEEQINDIKVDGADRKWMATNNGVWLLSADGQKVINQFTSSNSGLLDNKVYSIVIDPQSGEVFFMTQKGICSFRGTATAATESIRKPFVFPNPVPPGFSGTIAIRDLPENAWVSIIELDGRLVYKTRSLGGQAIWNGKNYKGQRVSSGTYMIMISNQLNTQQIIGKIFFLK